MSYETKKSMENIMKLTLEEAIMSVMDNCIQLFFNTQQISLNWRLHSTVIDYMFFIFIVIPLLYIIGLLKYMYIQHKIQKRLSIVFLFDLISLFLLRIPKNNTKWCIEMVRTSNKSTFVLKNKCVMSDGQFHWAKSK